MACPIHLLESLWASFLTEVQSTEVQSRRLAEGEENDLFCDGRSKWQAVPAALAGAAQL